MFKFLFTAARLASRPILFKTPPIIRNVSETKPIINQVALRQFSSVLSHNSSPSKLLADPKIQQISNNIITRNVISYSLKKGKRKSVKAVLKRFYRLNWGIWIRTKCGRNKKLWRKSGARRRRLRQHVFCNATQSRMLDKMVGLYWMKPRHYADDPYGPYHTREEFAFSAKKPRPYFPPETEH